MYFVTLALISIATSSNCVVNAPVSIDDLERFPDAKPYEYVLDEQLGYGYRKTGYGVEEWASDAKSHWEFCKQQLDLRTSPWHNWGSMTQEAFRVSEAWRWLDEAQRYTWNTGTQLMALGELRRLIGEENYWCGRMPTPQTWHIGYIP